MKIYKMKAETPDMLRPEISQKSLHEIPSLVGKFALAICSYQASDEKELSIEKNDRLKILQVHSSGWWKVQRDLNGGIGWIPKDFIRPLEKTIISSSMLHENTTLPKYKSEHTDLRRQSSNLKESSSSIIKQGYLYKRGHFRKNVKRRYFVLKNDSLKYYHSQLSQNEPLGTLDLSDPSKCTLINTGKVIKDGKVRYIFTLKVPNKDEYEIDTLTYEEFKSWTKALENVLQRKSYFEKTPLHRKSN